MTQTTYVRLSEVPIGKICRMGQYYLEVFPHGYKVVNSYFPSFHTFDRDLRYRTWVEVECEDWNVEPERPPIKSRTWLDKILDIFF